METPGIVVLNLVTVAVCIGTVMWLWRRQSWTTDHASVVQMRREIEYLTREKNLLISSLASARIEIEKLKDEVHQLEQRVRDAEGGGYRSQNRTLLVGTAGGGKFWMDMAALRGSPVPLNLIRLRNLTKEKLKRHLSRARRLGKPIEMVHLALHISAEGAQFDDGPVDGEWLSENLEGVRVLVLAGCSGDDLADWLGVVPHVVSFREPISDEDAAIFGQAFWTEIARGGSPDVALDVALQRSPVNLAGVVEKHW